MPKNKKASALMLLLLLMAVSFPLMQLIPPASAQGAGGNLGPNNGEETAQWAPELYPQWRYRIKLNVSEPNKVSRINEPVNVFLSFTDNKAKINSFRVMMYNSSGWFNVTTQVWNYTLYQPSGYTKTATVTFLANITKSQSSIYYLYYSDQTVPDIQYEPFVSATNGTFKSPNTNLDIHYTDIATQSYQAQVAWEYGYLLDFYVGGKDLVGEYYRKTYPVEVGAITDVNNAWREEVRNLPQSDQAQLVSFTSGPVFTRIALNKTTTYSGYISVDRVWTFYPDFWTVEATVSLTRDETTLIYSRIFHNGSKTYYSSLEGDDNNVIDNSVIEVKYYQSGRNTTRSAVIDGVGYTEKLQISGITTPYWYAVYKSGFAYSCVPAQGSEVNYFIYYDYTGANPYHYGSAGWGYYATPISTYKSWYGKMVYTPHAGQSNSSFADIDRNKIYNPLNVQNLGSEYYRENLVRFSLKDFSNNYLINATVQLYNSSASQPVGNSTSDMSGVAAFTKIFDAYTYNITVWYIIDGVERSVASVSGLSFTANYTRTASFEVDCNVNRVNIRLIEGVTGQPLYNYKIIINSTSNGINMIKLSDAYGWHNLTLPTSPSSIYGIDVRSPSDIPKTDNITSVDVKVVSTIIVNVTETAYVTSLSLYNYLVQISPGTAPGGRSSYSQIPVEIYWADTLTFTVEFRNVTGNSPITDATSANWAVYYSNSTLVSSGSASHWSDGRYNFTLSATQYGSTWGQTVTLKVDFTRTSCVSPPTLIIPIHVKSWATSVSTSPENYAWSYWRENITLNINYVSTLNLTSGYLDISSGTSFTAYIEGAGYTGYFADHPLHNGTVILYLNLTNHGIGSYNLIIYASNTHYASQQITLQLAVQGVPTYGAWLSTELYQYDDMGLKAIRAAFDEAVPITVSAYSNSTQNYPSQPLISAQAVYNWDKGYGVLTEGDPGSYSASIPLTGLVSGEDDGNYTITIFILKDNCTPLQLYISIEILEKWPTQLTIVSRNPSGNVFWGNNLTLTVNYSCSLTPRNGLGLGDALLGFDWPSGYWSYVYSGNGIYDVTINSSAYNITGTNTDLLIPVTLSSSKQYYAPSSRETSIGIRRITSLVELYVDGVKDPPTFELIILENKTVLVDFRVLASQSIFQNQLISGANLTAVIKNSDSGVVLDNASLVETAQKGVYILRINSTELYSVVNAPYSIDLEIYAKKDNYEHVITPQTFKFTLRPINVKSVISELSGGKLEGTVISVNKGDQVKIKFMIEDSDHNLTLTDTLLTVTLRSGGQIVNTFQPTHLGGGVYEINISTSDLEGPYILTIEVDAGDNYSTLTTTYNLQVIPPLPVLLIAIIGAVSAAAIPLGYRGFRYYQWVKKPLTVKRILESLKYIKKMKNFNIVSPVTRASNIRSKLNQVLSEPALDSFKLYLGESALTLDAAKEGSSLYNELSNRISTALPGISDQEKRSLIDELIGLSVDEREFLLKSIVEERKLEKPSSKDNLSVDVAGDMWQPETEKIIPPASAHPQVVEELDRLLKEGLITEQEKAILSVEILDMPVEEQIKFLNSLKDKKKDS